MRKIESHSYAPRNERGVALVIAMVIVLLMMLLGISSLRTVGLEEKMSGQTYDRSLAFQAAEAALRVGEAEADTQDAMSPKNQGFPNNGAYTDSDDTCSASAINNCTSGSGLCAVPDKDCTARWESSSFTGWKTMAVGSGSSTQGLKSGTAGGAAPQYFVEYLGNSFACNPENSCPDNSATPVDPCNCTRYRITARSNPGSGRSTVILQSIYAAE